MDEKQEQYDMIGAATAIEQRLKDMCTSILCELGYSVRLTPIVDHDPPHVIGDESEVQLDPAVFLELGLYWQTHQAEYARLIAGQKDLYFEALWNTDHEAMVRTWPDDVIQNARLTGIALVPNATSYGNAQQQALATMIHDAAGVVLRERIEAVRQARRDAGLPDANPGRRLSTGY